MAFQFSLINVLMNCLVNTINIGLSMKIKAIFHCVHRY